jgi:uncharacterized protein (DUF58 family)
MGFSSLVYDKASYAKTAAATIAYFLALQRDAVGLITFDEGIKDYLPARFRPGHLHRLMMALEHAPAGTATDLAAPLEQVAKTASKRGLVILLSDLLAPLEAIETRLGYLRSRGHEVVVMRVLDPAEVDFPFQEAALFQDVESGRELYVDPQVARQRYQQRFADHAGGLATSCNKLGIDLMELVTSRPLEIALFDFVATRLRRGRTVSRRQASGRAAPAGGRR